MKISFYMNYKSFWAGIFIAWGIDCIVGVEKNVYLSIIPLAVAMAMLFKVERFPK